MIFWSKFAQKGCFQSKTEKANITNEFLHIRISPGTKFQLTLTVLIFFDQICQNKVFMVEKSHLWSMVVTYYIKCFLTRTERHGILMSLLLLAAETIIVDLLSINWFLFSRASEIEFRRSFCQSKNIRELWWMSDGVMRFWFLLGFLFISASVNILASLSVSRVFQAAFQVDENAPAQAFLEQLSNLII